jgi:hypothetical protein
VKPNVEVRVRKHQNALYRSGALLGRKLILRRGLPGKEQSGERETNQGSLHFQ